MKTIKQKQLRDWCELNFYSEVSKKRNERIAWEPFENWDDEALQEQVDNQADSLAYFLRSNGIEVKP
jgi:hypothetical protein